MKGESRKKKTTDWKAFGLQIMASIVSELILKLLSKLFE